MVAENRVATLTPGSLSRFQLLEPSNVQRSNVRLSPLECALTKKWGEGRVPGKTTPTLPAAEAIGDCVETPVRGVCLIVRNGKQGLSTVRFPIRGVVYNERSGES